MSIQQILKSREILVDRPRCAKSGRRAGVFEGDVRPVVPASILRTHPNVTMYLDEPAAARLDRRDASALRRLNRL